MPPLSLNEIKQRAVKFSKEWAAAASEEADAKTFWDEFFGVFGVRRRDLASFEVPVKKLAGDYGYIDLFWKGTLLVEHKSRGKNLEKAESQAFGYIQDLISDGRNSDVPRYVILSDFDNLSLYDLDTPSEPKRTDFHLKDLHKHAHQLSFIAGYQQYALEDQDPINIKAAEILGDLHDALAAGGYKGHDLERFLVRILFCLFAEDTRLFEGDSFRMFVRNRTSDDGADLGVRLAELFEVLDTPREERHKDLDEVFKGFPYVNGGLFSERLKFAHFNTDMRVKLLLCTEFDWSQISPAIFGSLFQSVMEPKERRQMGAHYTSERDILKVVRALFLDDLRAEFVKIRGNKPELKRFQQKLAGLTFFDPACGCGNFLVIAYRELRLLELELLKDLFSGGQQVIDVTHLSLVDVDAFYGIEMAEWPVRIAEVAMWFMDHQMNLLLSDAFGQYYARLPLKKSPTIICGNALSMDWRAVLAPEKCTYILGNPPFVGKKARTAEQQAEMEAVFAGVRGAGTLDYVCAWYMQASRYIKDTNTQVGFVSTNSISQGEQPGILWKTLFTDYKIKINFAYRAFKWESEARGKAQVHVVIIGFSRATGGLKRIYETIGEDISAVEVKNISPYLVEGKDFALDNREKALSPVPEIQFGNMPNDGGNFLLTDEEKSALLSNQPLAGSLIRPFLSAKEYLHNTPRWCIWLQGVAPGELAKLPEILRRVEAVKRYREESSREATRNLAQFPSLFGEIRQPKTPYVLIPRHSSENRNYIPLSYFTPTEIVGDSCLFVANATLYHFGVLSSAMHMAWVRQVCGRLKSDYRYSNKLVYNNYPWPESPAEKQVKAVEAAAQAVLDARNEFTQSTLADLYSPLTMPPALVKAHAAMDRAVDAAYRPQPFPTERLRVEYLFSLYEKLTAPLLSAAKKMGKKGNTGLE